MITILDYGLGNIASIANMIKKVGGKSIITSDINEIAKAEKLILPGVGAFKEGFKNLNEGGYINILNKKVLEDKIPILGICLGMQLLTRKSEEGNSKGLAWIEADTVKFDISKLSARHKIPHMGWSDINIKKNKKLLGSSAQKSRYYFVHSYHVACDNISDIMCTANYGYEFVCGVQKGNILGVQFHPEKSHKFGMNLIRNFINNF